MRLFAPFLLVLAAAVVAANAQPARKTTKFPASVPVKEAGIESAGGSVEGRKYTNKRFGFSLVVPDNWFIAGPDFEKVVKEKGFDLRSDDIAGRANRNIEILMTAFRSDSAGRENAVLRVTSENLRPNPQILDAVDYFDAITAAFMSTKLPPDFSYSATKAEQLGPNQFAFLDTNSSSGKKRLYATVRNRNAIMFTLSYNDKEDLEEIRRVLTSTEFFLK